MEILGSNHVYFQPPPTVQMKYPCFVYERSGIPVDFANNNAYNIHGRYKITYIGKDPDSIIPEKVLASKLLAAYDRHYTSDNLNHDVFTVYWEGSAGDMGTSSLYVSWENITDKPDIALKEDLTWDTITGKPEVLTTADLTWENIIGAPKMDEYVKHSEYSWDLIPGKPADVAVIQDITWENLQDIPDNLAKLDDISWDNIKNLPDNLATTDMLTWSNLTGVPETLVYENDLTWANVKNKPSNLATIDDIKWSNIPDIPENLASLEDITWNNLKGKPQVVTKDELTWSNIANRPDNLVTTDTLTWDNVSGKPTNLATTDQLTWDSIQNKPQVALKSDIVSVFRYRGSVATAGDLPTQGVNVGDTYNVESTGMNYSWDGTAWDALGGSFELETVTSEELNTIFEEVFGNVGI